MHPEKVQNTKSDDASKDEQVLTSTEGNLLFITKICNSSTIFYFR